MVLHKHLDKIRGHGIIDIAEDMAIAAGRSFRSTVSTRTCLQIHMQM